jgi:hypothetical protein
MCGSPRPYSGASNSEIGKLFYFLLYLNCLAWINRSALLLTRGSVDRLKAFSGLWSQYGPGAWLTLATAPIATKNQKPTLAGQGWVQKVRSSRSPVVSLTW